MSNKIEPLAISPPQGLWVDRTYSLKVSSWNTVSGLDITCRARMISVEGEVVPIEFSFTPTSDALVTEKYFSLFSGWIVGATLVPSISTLRHGQCWTRISLQRGVHTTFDDGVVLAQAYLSSTSLVSWPSVVSSQSTNGAGYIFSTAVSDPTVGTDFAYTVPTNRRQIVHGVTFSLVTDATVSNRSVKIAFQDSNLGTISVSVHTTAQTASSTEIYYFVPNFPVLSNSTIEAHTLLPVLPLGQDYRIISAIKNLQPGDQVGDIQIFGEEWIED